MVKSCSVFKTQTKHSLILLQLPWSLELNTLFTCLLKGASLHLTAIVLIFIHLPAGLWILDAKMMFVFMSLSPRTVPSNLKDAKNKVLAHNWKCEYMKVFLNWEVSLQFSNYYYWRWRTWAKRRIWSQSLTLEGMGITTLMNIDATCFLQSPAEEMVSALGDKLLGVPR